MTSWWKDPMILATVTIAAATFINVVVTIFLGVFTYNIYKHTNRPYIGISGINISKQANVLNILLLLRNAGNIPAVNVSEKHFFYINGQKLTDAIGKIYSNYNLLPDSILRTPIGIGMPYYNDIITGKDKLEFEIIITYNGTGNNQYKDYEKYEYISSQNIFVAVASSIE